MNGWKQFIQKRVNRNKTDFATKARMLGLPASAGAPALAETSGLVVSQLLPPWPQCTCIWKSEQWSKVIWWRLGSRCLVGGLSVLLTFFAQHPDFISSEGALIAITPYDYTAPTFWAHTGPRQQLEHKWWLWWQILLWWLRSHKMSNDTECQMTQNVKWHKMSNDTCQMTQNVKWHTMSNDTKRQMTQNVKRHKMSNDTKCQMT